MSSTDKDYLQRTETAAQNLAQYAPSADVAAANQKLADVNAGKPAEYTNADADRLGGIYDQIMNRGPFSYDVNGDKLYQQYKDAYQRNGQNAAQNTTAQINSMSGGYGSTWAQSAGAQQYGEYLKGMNDIIPALERNAYAAYASEGDRLNDLYNMARQQDETAYGRYRDEVSDWQQDRSFAAQQADNAYARDYTAYSNRLQAAQTAAGWELEDSMQQKSDMQSWAITLIQKGIMPTDDVLAQAGISADDAVRLAKKYGYGKSGGSGSRNPKKSGGATTPAATTPTTQRTTTIGGNF